MPVIHIGRDPVLISIDRQRLNDLGIPAEPGHEHVSALYGVLGVVRPVLVVPEGWEYALPVEWPPPEEWDHEEWERAENDSSNESPAHARPVPLASRIDAAGAALMVVCAFVAGCMVLGIVVRIVFAPPAERLSQRPEAGGMMIGTLVFAFAGVVLLSPIIAMLSKLAGKILRHPYGVPVVAVLLLFFCYNPLLAVLSLPFLRCRA